MFVPPSWLRKRKENKPGMETWHFHITQIQTRIYRLLDNRTCLKFKGFYLDLSFVSVTLFVPTYQSTNLQYLTSATDTLLIFGAMQIYVINKYKTNLRSGYIIYGCVQIYRVHVLLKKHQHLHAGDIQRGSFL